MKSIWGLSLLPLLAAGSPVIFDSTHDNTAPVISSSNAKHISDSYMVIFKKHVHESAAAAHHSWVQNIHLTSQNVRTELRKRSQASIIDTVFDGLRHTYHIPNGLLGYAGHFDEDVLEQIRRHPDVDYIERDSEVHVMSSDGPATETGAPWGLARISHRKKLGFGTFNKYLYSEGAGEGVDTYVIDTGTNYEHVEFEGRAHWGKTIPAGEPEMDDNGHGTHCSGTIAGAKFGVAKKANVYAVKVLNGQGSGAMSDVVKGVEYAVTQHKKSVDDAKNGKKKGFKGSVANMSLGGGKSTTLDLAVNAAVDNGLHFAVAAGNDNSDACNSSPAAAEKAITVCASTLSDERAYFSNFGKCTDVFAPGLNILSAWIGSEYATKVISGTSMASPHVCGLVAYFLSLQPASDSSYAVEQISPKKLKNAILAIATKDLLSDVPANTPNLLIWNGGGESNFTKIVDHGGYDGSAYFYPKNYVQAKTSELKAELKDIAQEIEELIQRV